MLRVTGIKIRWLAIMKSLVPADAMTPRTVNYIAFLGAFTQESLKQQNDSAGESQWVSVQTV